jgi:hypothetical protein
MAEENKRDDLGRYLWRGGERIELARCPSPTTTQAVRGIPSPAVMQAATLQVLLGQSLQGVSGSCGWPTWKPQTWASSTAGT